jgi:hypothetical protein
MSSRGNNDNTTQEIAAWLEGRLPAEWTAAGRPEVSVDREEVVVVLAVAPPGVAEATGQGDAGQDDARGGGPEAGSGGTEGEADEARRRAAEAGRIAGFRADTRERRIGIAREVEHRFGRSVAWGVRCGGSRELFTHLAVPVMTRLRQPERLVLDTLVEAGVARSRAHALAWCVALVGEHADDWLAELRSALERVRAVRAQGPGAA